MTEAYCLDYAGRADLVRAHSQYRMGARRLQNGHCGRVQSHEFRVPIDREIPAVTDAEWEAPRAAAHRLGLSTGRLRLLANADTVRVVFNSEGEQGLLRRSVDYEVERRTGATLWSRVRIWVGDLLLIHVPDKRRTHPWGNRRSKPRA